MQKPLRSITELRQRAEAELRRKGPQVPDTLQDLSREQLQQLLYELSVFQLELELQSQELLQATSELESSRADYADLYNSAPVGYCTLDESGRLLQVNLACARLLGQDVADLTGKLLRHFVDPIDRSVFASFCSDLLQSGHTKAVEIRLTGHAAAPIWVLLEASLTRQPDTHPLLRVIMVDVSARKLAQQAADSSHDTLKGILDTTLDGFWQLDRAGRLLDVNAVYCQQSGYRRADLLGCLVDDFDAQQNPSCIAEQLKHLIRYGHMVFETRHRRQDGSLWDVEVSATFDPQGGGLIYAFCRDVTARKQTARQLADSEERWKFAVEGSGEGVWDWHIDTGHAVFSKQYKEMLGYAEEDIGNDASEWTSRVNPQDMPRVMQVLQDHLAAKTSAVRVEFRMRCKDGSWRWMLGRGMVVARDAAGKPVRLVGTNSDIHEPKQVQQQEQLHRLVLELLSSDAPWEQVLLALVQGVGQAVPDVLCAILLLDEAGSRFVYSVAPGLPDSFTSAVLRASADAGVGCSGLFACTGERQMVPDMAAHAGWQQVCAEAACAGLAACWLQPIRGTAGHVLGSFVVYRRQTHCPDAAEIALVENCAHLAGIALERHRAAEKLRASEAHFRLLTEDVSDVVWKLDVDFRVTYISPADEAMRGYRADEVIGSSMLEWLAPEGVAKIEKRLEAWADMGQLPHGSVIDEVQQRCKDGRMIWTEVLARMEFDALGRISGFHGTTRDISRRRLAQAALQESEDRFRTIVEHSPDPVAVFRAGRLIYANSAAVRLLRAPNVQVLMGVSMLELVHPDSKLAVQVRASALQRPGDTTDLLEEKLLRLDGTTVHVEAQSTVMVFNAEPAIHVTVRDISVRKQAEERLRLAAAVFNHTREGILVLSLAGIVIDLNDAVTRLTGYSRAEVLGHSPRERFCAELHAPEVYEVMARELHEKGFWSGELWNRRKNGEVFASLQAISMVRDESGVEQSLVVLFSDISALKVHEKELERMAHFDVLTGLSNRVLLADRMRQAMAQALRREQSIAVVYLDLDGFKAVNDSRGHTVGDRLLMALANRMRQALREGDTLARVGGDEFVALLVDIDRTGCDTMVARLVDAAAQPVLMDGFSVQVSASLGITFYPQPHDIDAELLLQQADRAMYQAKLAGKNCYRYFQAEPARATNLMAGLAPIDCPGEVCD
ncbi:MAG TPA: PAS domain S-box protein [Rhodoferax sp.]|nr:PAS domain S-box protein [Rhodoferax sp.]